VAALTSEYTIECLITPACMIKSRHIEALAKAQSGTRESDTQGSLTNNNLALEVLGITRATEGDIALTDQKKPPPTPTSQPLHYLALLCYCR